MTADTRTPGQMALAKIAAIAGWTTGRNYGTDRVILFLDSDDAAKLAALVSDHWSEYED